MANMIDTTNNTTTEFENTENIEGTEMDENFGVEEVEEVDENGQIRKYQRKVVFDRSIPTPDENTIISPLKAIRAKCLDCCCGQRTEVGVCPCKDCPLWAFRFGKNPYYGMTVDENGNVEMNKKRKRVMSDEHKAKLIEGRKKARAEKKNG